MVQKIVVGFSMGCSLLAICAAPALAGPAATCVEGANTATLECGTGSVTLSGYSAAIGQQAEVGANSQSGTAVGAYSDVFQEDGTAVGANAKVNAGLNGSVIINPTPGAIGGTAIGRASRTQGDDNVAVGGWAVVGEVALFTQVNQGTAIGAGSNVSEDGGTALGARAVASGTNAVAIGSNSVASEDDTVSFGSATTSRRLTNIADGTAATDAASVGQLQIVNGQAIAAQTTANSASAAAATAQTTANSASTAAATAQASANAASQRTVLLGQSTAAAFGGGAQFDPATGTMTAPSYTIGGANYGSIGSALTALDERINSFTDAVNSNREENRRGIASALALAQAPFPSQAGRTSYTANTATYRGEWAMSGSLSHRLNVDMPIAISAGISYAGDKHTAARFGIAGEF